MEGASEFERGFEEYATEAWLGVVGLCIRTSRHYVLFVIPYRAFVIYLPFV